MTREDQPDSGFAARMAYARQEDPAEDAFRTHVRLKIVAVTLAWLVVVPLLLGYALTGRNTSQDALTAAALLTLLGPFVAAVIATKNHRLGLGGVYIVLTLLMVVPAVVIARI